MQKTLEPNDILCRNFLLSRTFSTFIGKTRADMIRLNVAISPTATPHPPGVAVGEIGDYPIGRRTIDDIVTIELKQLPAQ
jgi:Domain of unknown function (DUF4331)